MKKLILLLSLFTLFANAQTTAPTRNAGGFGAGFTSNDMAPSSILEARSTTKGFLAPRMTTTQRNAISSPATGLQVYNTTTNKFNYYNGSAWVEFGGGAGATPTLPEVLTAGDRETVILTDGANHTITLGEANKYLVQAEAYDLVLNAGVFPDNTELYVYNASGGNILVSGSANIISTNIIRNNSLALIKKIVNDDTWALVRLESSPYTPTEIGLGNVNNTTDLNKPISTATQTALDNLTASVTSQFQGLKVKTPVRLLASTNITLSGTSTTIDGITVNAGDRVIANGQTTTSQNGCYVVSSGSWTRATDSDTAVELDKAIYFVLLGANNGGKIFLQSADFPAPGAGTAQWVNFLSYPTPTDLDALKRDGSNANSNVNIGSYSIVAGGGTFSGDVTGNAIPTGATSFITKNYLDNQISGISWKQAVKCATTTNVSLSGTSNIDGVTIPAGTRILVKNQTTTTENGIYVSAAGAWSRATDADTGAELETSTVAVTAGTINKNTQWTCTAVSITVGTTPISYAQISGAGTYTNGTGIDLTANVFSLTSSVQSQLTNAIPYTGATTDVDLGSYNITATKIISNSGCRLQSTAYGVGLTDDSGNLIAVYDGTDTYKYGNGHLTYNESTNRFQWDGVAIAKVTDIPDLSGYATSSDLTTGLATKVTANGAITGATKAKITYDSKGLVTAGADLSATDIPTGVDASKINTGVVSNTEFNYLDGVTSAIQTQISGKEPTITAGTTSQYWRGDKSWQTLNSTAVGLGNVDNTSDVNKPVSTAQATAIALKQDKSLSAYKFVANNTNATDNATEQAFKSPGKQALSATGLVFTGTPPSGTATLSYNFTQIGSVVTVNVKLLYSVAGASNTSLTVPFPSDLPTPVQPTGFTSASEKLYVGVGQFSTSKTVLSATLGSCFVRNNSGANGYEIVITSASTNAITFEGTVTYFTN